LNIAYRKLEDHNKYVDKDVEEGKLTIEQSTLIKKYLNHHLGIIQNLATQADSQRLQVLGKLSGLEQIVKITKSLHDAEKVKFDAVSNDDDVKHVTGEHPGNPILERKLQSE
jgi:hypothetical protein